MGYVFKSDHETAILIALQLDVPSIFCVFISKRFIHSNGMCRMRQFLAVLRSFFHSSLLCTFSCHPSPPTILPSSLTSSCHLFLGLPQSCSQIHIEYPFGNSIFFHSLNMPKSTYLFNLTVSITAGFLTLA